MTEYTDVWDSDFSTESCCGASSGAPTGFGDQPEWEQPAWEQPAWDQPVFEQPQLEQPDWDVPEWDVPTTQPEQDASFGGMTIGGHSWGDDIEVESPFGAMTIGGHNPSDSIHSDGTWEEFKSRTTFPEPVAPVGESWSQFQARSDFGAAAVSVGLHNDAHPGLLMQQLGQLATSTQNLSDTDIYGTRVTNGYPWG